MSQDFWRSVVLESLDHLAQAKTVQLTAAAAVISQFLKRYALRKSLLSIAMVLLKQRCAALMITKCWRTSSSWKRFRSVANHVNLLNRIFGSYFSGKGLNEHATGSVFCGLDEIAEYSHYLPWDSFSGNLLLLPQTTKLEHSHSRHDPFQHSTKTGHVCLW